jgi:hypothetical protein
MHHNFWMLLKIRLAGKRRSLTWRKDVSGFAVLDDPPPAIGTLIDPLGQLGIGLAVLAEPATEPIAGLPYTP